jgi:predicted RNase H-like HicB family nuclease
MLASKSFGFASPEGIFLAASDDIQGLVAQGRTIAEAIEITRDVSRKLLEAQSNRNTEGSNGVR